MKERYYKVASHTFALLSDSEQLISDEELRQYQPFATEPAAEVVFRLRLTASVPPLDHSTVEVRQDDEGQEIVAGYTAQGLPFFEFWLGGSRSSVLVTNADYTEGTVATEAHRQFGVNNALMVMYALATAAQQTALFHSSVVSNNGRAYMFLGKSGTGKSTHSSLWLKYIEGTRLVNDDNPVVRIVDGEARVYGSPWSGKTPCYRNVDFPVGAIVQLKQAPYNAIRRLRPLEAYASLVPSISGKRWDRRVADGLHHTEELIIERVPICHLDCLPDEAAARLCHAEVTKG